MISNESDSSAPENLTSSSAGGGSSKANYWRSITELRGEAEFNEYLDREFPVAASEFPEGVSRRRWMQLMGASLAVAGAAGCRYPKETIEPFVIRPEGRVPGENYERATNFELAGRVYNLLVTCVDGRPLKVEPNPSHPGGAGTDAYAQASVLQLYDPDRARGDEGFLLRKSNVETDNGRRFEVDWSEFDPVGKSVVEAAGDGAGFALLMAPTSSPSLVRMVNALKERLPKATVCQYDGVAGDVMGRATKAAFGKQARQTLDLEQAEVILALQADILGTDRGMLSNAVGFGKRRDPGPDNKAGMNRLYVVEGGFTSTGAAADSRLALRPSEIPKFLAELGRRVEKLAADGAHEHEAEEKAFDEISAEDRLERFLDVLSHDLAAAGGKAVVVVGDHLGAEAIEAGIRMNQKLGSFGKLQKFTPRVDDGLSTGESLAGLVEKINGGQVNDLLILGDNPVYTAPGGVDLAAALGKLGETEGTASIYLGEYDDETGAVCDWSLPLSHQLESWGDCVSDHGYYGVCQPQILPLLGGRSAIELIAMMLGEKLTDGGAIVRRAADQAAAQAGGSDLSDREWRGLLHDGFIEKLKNESGALELISKPGEAESGAPVAIATVDKDQIEVIFNPADGLYDGRFANNGWLQEMPQALTKLAWDNAAVMSPATARGISLDPDATDSSAGNARVLRHGQMVALRIGDEKVELPVYEMPGCAPGVITVTLGYGRERVGMVGGDPGKGVDVVGFDVSAIRRDEGVMIAYGVEGRPRYTDYVLATTQDHWAIDERGRDETEERSFTLVREGTAELYKRVSKFAEVQGPHVPLVGPDDNGSPWVEPLTELEQENKENGVTVPQWGMSVDLGKCIGCSACVVACQSENNVPIVGREQVMNSREMHWLRLDRYFQGDETNADIVQEPVACMHCETAPCEQVCPVAATVHTEEGINAMAYNRCIGTRYCANNCPFKVRRFNYFNYNEDIGTGYGIDAYPSHIESANRKLQALVMNPEVTVRGRGVMEKCTYCIQRVEGAKINAIKEGRDVADGDVVTACQSACPTRAIEFGDISDPGSAVSKKRKDDRSYGMLGQLNLKTRTQYLARVTNPHRRLMTAKQVDELLNMEQPHSHGHGDHHESHDDDHGDGDHDHESHEAEEHGAGEHDAAAKE
jgi:molybdopterin-containing oxidoreductase family iron-sulfur binding subunit